MKLVKSDVKLLWLAGCVHKMPTLVAAPPWSVIFASVTESEKSI